MQHNATKSKKSLHFVLSMLYLFYQVEKGITKMYELTAEAIAEFMETKKGVKAEKIEAYKYGSKTAYLVNESHRVAIETKGSVLPSSIGTNYKPKINGRKITKRAYNRSKGDYELQQTL
jgi:hypothetical protein